MGHVLLNNEHSTWVNNISLVTLVNRQCALSHVENESYVMLRHISFSSKQLLTEVNYILRLFLNHSTKVNNLKLALLVFYHEICTNLLLIHSSITAPGYQLCKVCKEVSIQSCNKSLCAKSSIFVKPCRKMECDCLT